MDRTLVLVIDRDDDFGVKANVQTPIIGLDDILQAASRLGVVDPEDSDINTVYSAVKIYNELRDDGRDAEIALICGDTKVGHRSDMKVADELDTVIGKVAPNRAILVSDGAEDEHVFPMISSRLKVDSIKKVYVKQAPGLEGAFYILMKILHDDDKRKRLLAPIGIVLLVIATILMIPVFVMYNDTGNMALIYNATGIFVAFSISLIIVLYAYKIGGRLMSFIKRLLTKLESGNMTAIFMILAIGLFCIGIVLGVYASTAPSIDLGQRVIIFFSNSLWVLVFAYICNDFGKFLEVYIEQKKILLGFMVGTLMIFAAAFIIQGTLDAMSVVFGYYIIGQDMILVEFLIGFIFAASAGMMQVSYKRFINKNDAAERSDALQ